MQVYNTKGRPLDAEVLLKRRDDDTLCIVFESRGPGRNRDYIAAFDAVLSRLAGLSAVLLDATVVSRETQHLPIRRKRLVMAKRRYPIQLTFVEEGIVAARSLRRAAAAVGRPKSARGGGNPTKRVEILFAIPRHKRAALPWLTRNILRPSISDESLAIEDYVRPRPRSFGQGPGLTQEQRRAVELYAMRHAKAHYRRLGWRVRDISAQRRILDLVCNRKSRELHVEVKGTTGYGDEILLTRNEVRHALERYPHVSLFVLTEIALKKKAGRPVATGGTPRVFDPWRLARNRLEPRVYSLTLSQQTS